MIRGHGRAKVRKIVADVARRMQAAAQQTLDVIESRRSAFDQMRW